VKVAVVALAATVTLAGTWAAAGLPLDKVTTAPPVGAGALNLTVAVEEVPPTTDVGLSVIVLRTAAVTVKLAVCVAPKVAEIVSGVFVATEVVVTVKVAEVALAATVTLDGTCAAAILLLNRVTTAPPAGAGPFSVTVPVEELPPSTDEGLRLTKASAGAVTVKLAFWVVP